jgi:phosphomannomutase
LGVEAVYLNRDPHGRFPRSPEPVPENLGDLSNAVREQKADFGIAVDPDVDRLALVSEEGIPLGEEYTLGLVTRFILSSAPGPVVVNASTSQMIDDIAGNFQQPVYRTPVGEIHVAQKARAVGAAIAGEGNGGVMYPELHIGRDAPVGISLVLQHLTEQNQSMSACFQQLPQYKMVKDKLTLAFDTDTRALLHKLADAHKTDTIDQTDGYKFIYDASWVHVRASNTEPIIRVIAEAPSRKEAQSLVKEFKNEISTMVKK